MSQAEHQPRTNDDGPRTEPPADVWSDLTSERCREILDSLPQIVYACDPRGDIVFANRSAFRVSGYSAEDVRAGLNALRMIVPADRDRARANMERVLRGQVAVGNEYLFLRKDGSTFPCAILSEPRFRDGKLAGLCGLVLDVSERYGMEQRLRQSEARYRTMVEQLHEGIWVVDAAERTVFVNLHMAEMLGYAPEEMQGRRLFEFMDSANVASCQERMAQRRRGSRDVHAFTFLRKDGAPLHTRVAANPLFDDNGNYAGTMAAITDLTDQQRMDTELRETNRRLEATLAELRLAQDRIVREERLHALGQMAGGIAHEFNNALTPIVGFAELLLEKRELSSRPEKLRLYLEMIHAAARDAAKIVRALSDFCRQKEFADVFGPVELNELIDEVVSLTQPKWKTEAAAEGHRIEVVVEQDQLPDVHGDKAGLREVLTNLVFNAVEAMPGGGTIVIRTQREEREALLSVSDNGEGMSDDVRQRCMEPFFTTRGARSTGMGLPAALGIVRRHGGALQVQSEPGAGTTVTARLPLVAAPHEVVRNSLDIPRTVPAAVRILIVDDEPLNLRFIEAALRTHGYDVDTADSGEEAVRKLGTARYALVITDWAMGGLHGGDVAAYVRQCSHGTPLILLTGLDELPPADKPLPNVSLVLHKPVGIGPLTEAVARLTRSPAPAA